ncbi:MAG: transcriptional antiterminator NusG [Bacteroidia bacterium]|jgi:transcriptional antiterminator NusG
METKWYVFYVASRQEKKVAERISKLEITCYLPLAKKLRTWSDRKKWVDFPMFSGYVFVNGSLNTIDLVLNVPGVIQIISHCGSYATVRQKEIEIIRIVEESGYYAETIYGVDDFNEGDQLQIVEGPLKGNKVSLLRKNNERIFLIAFEQLGQSIKMNIPFEMLGKS